MEEFIDGRDPAPGDDPPVTAVASRRVKQGREQEFEEWLSGILAAAKEAPGYLGSEVLRPSDSEDDNEYRIVFRGWKRATGAESDSAPSWLRRATLSRIQNDRPCVATTTSPSFTIRSWMGTTGRFIPNDCQWAPSSNET